MNRLITYIKSSFNEVVHNVTWPSGSSLQESIVLVIVGTFIFGGLIRLVDIALELLAEYGYGIL